MAILSFAVARVALAVFTTLAPILSFYTHLSSIKVRHLGRDTNNEGFSSSGLPCIAHVRVHLAPPTAIAALAARAAPTVSSTARHFLIFS